MPTPLEASQSRFHAPVVNLQIGDQSNLEFLNGTSTYGKQLGSSVTTFTLTEDPVGLPPDTTGMQLVVNAGWAGATPATNVVASGKVEADQTTSYSPYRRQIRAHGPTFRLNRPLVRPLSFDSGGSAPWQDTMIIRELALAQGLVDAEIGALQGLGSGYVFFRYHQLALKRGDNPQGTITTLDQIGGYWTYDLASVPPTMVRVVWNPTPAVSPVASFIEGTSNIRDIRVERHPESRVSSFSVRGFQQPSASWYPYASRLDSSVAVPARVGGSFETDYIEADALADLAAQVGMREHNSDQAMVTLDIPGCPLLAPGVTFAVQSPHNRLPTLTNVLTSEVTHTFTSKSWRTRVSGYLGGAAGVVATDMHRPPIAIIDSAVSRETVIRTTPVTIYTVNADSRDSKDVQGFGESLPLPLTRQWRNNKHADAGNPTVTETIYYTEFSVAEYGDISADFTVPKNRPRIYLKLTDRDGNLAEAEQVIDALTLARAVTIQERELYACVGGLAWCTPNGGDVQRNVNFGSNAISVPPMTVAEWGWFGLADGRLMFTKDYLLTYENRAPAAGSGVFRNSSSDPDPVTAIWVHEVDSARIVVGTESGRIWTSPDGGKTWALAYEGGAAITMVTASIDNRGQVFWSEAGHVYYSDQLFRAPYAGLATDIAYGGGDIAGFTLSYVDHYAFGSNGLQRARGGVTISLPGSTSPEIRAFHGLHDGLWVVDRDGNTWNLPEGALTGEARTAVPGSGLVHWVMRDGLLPLECYVARASGLYKSFSGMRAWDLIVPGNVTMVGYGGGAEKGDITSSANVPTPPAQGTGIPPLQPLTLFSTVAVKQFRVTPSLAESFPIDWDLSTYNDSAWATSTEATVASEQSIPTGATPIWTTATPVTDDEEVGFRVHFTLSAGFTGAILEVIGDDFVADITLNDNVFAEGPLTFDNNPTVIELPPSELLAGANLLAMRGINAGTDAAFVAFKLTVSYG